ncbi:MAG: hypothetical protein H6713_32030 [Myxococcales bacterium]|nr:hypothetical protein [Myxococcales bacterium]
MKTTTMKMKTTTKSTTVLKKKKKKKKTKTMTIALTVACALWATTSTARASDPRLERLPAAEELGRICFDDGGELQLTPDDVLWMAKMVHGETRGRPSREDASHMLWALAGRRYTRKRLRESMAALAQAYSQPISPRWLRDGDKCDSEAERERKRGCQEHRLRLRAEYRAMAWQDIDKLARATTLVWAQGNLPNPQPGIVGWYEPGTWRGIDTRTHYERPTLHDYVDGNAYYFRTHGVDTRAWTATTVTVVGPGALCPDHVANWAPKPKLGSCEDDFTYHKSGTIRSWTTRDDGTISELEFEGAGWRDRVCDDSKGMIYADDTSRAFVEDEDGQKIRFEMIEVDEHGSRARVFAGRLTPSMLEGRRRVVTRAKR